MGYCLQKRSPHCLYDISVLCSILCLFSPQVVKKNCYCRCYLRVCYCILTSKKLWIWLANLALLIVSRCRHQPQDVPNAIWYKPCKSLKLQKMLNEENWGTADGEDAEKDRWRWGAWWRVMSSRKGASIFFVVNGSAVLSGAESVQKILSMNSSTDKHTCLTKLTVIF